MRVQDVDGKKEVVADVWGMSRLEAKAKGQGGREESGKLVMRRRRKEEGGRSRKVGWRTLYIEGRNGQARGHLTLV